MRANFSSPWRINQDDVPWQPMPENGAQLNALPIEIGKCESKLTSLDTGFSMIETLYQPNRDLAVLSRITQQEPRLVLTLGLSGQSCFQANATDDICFKAGYSTITTFNASAGNRRYRGHAVVAQLRFTMTQGWLERYFGEGVFAGYFKENDLHMVSHHPSQAGTLIAAESLLQYQLHPQAQKLFHQGQAMSIVANELSHLLQSKQGDYQRFNLREKQLAEMARDILHAEFKEPPSIEALSKRVGTNPFKLKQLFHQYFSTTPYGMLLDIRMQKAQQMLMGEQCPVNQIAESVGYRHASNFSAAFIKYFGYSPKRLKTRNSH